MILIEAHVAGVPVEETLLQLLPAGGVMLAGVHLAIRRTRRKLAWRRRPRGPRRPARPPSGATDAGDGIRDGAGEDRGG
ncbi:MAG: hypothetical protein QOC78_3983 [Solirubrobacteraceae bacterium]|nr:hypothetical protein [Solirubrobacteraceae bacterium]